jgi:hypothetical protein
MVIFQIKMGRFSIKDGGISSNLWQMVAEY